MRKNELWNNLALFIIFAAGAAMRLYGIAWDEGYYFHPDERAIMFVVEDLGLPRSLGDFFSTESALNPGFFAYGSLPLYLLKIIVSLLVLWQPHWADLDHFFLVGRTFSAICDVGTVYLVYRLGHKLYGERVGILAAAFISFAVLHIQLTHFYTVDTALVFFIVLAMNTAVAVAQEGGCAKKIALGVAFGAALATKVSVAPFVLTVAVAWTINKGSLAPLRSTLDKQGKSIPSSDKIAWVKLRFRELTRSSVMRETVQTVLIALCTFIVLQPYAIIDGGSFVIDVFAEAAMARGNADYPYTRQYINTIPYLYQFRHTIIWGLGMPLGLTMFAGFIYAIAQVLWTFLTQSDLSVLWHRYWRETLLLSWSGTYFLLTGSMRVKYLRYMLPITPFMAIFAAQLLFVLWEKRKSFSRLFTYLHLAWVGITIGSAVVYALAFLNMYNDRHPWLELSTWMYRNIAPGTVLGEEHWDDGLPSSTMLIDGEKRRSAEYEVAKFEMYDPDDEEKLEHLVTRLQESEYIVLATNRLYGAIPRLEKRYPLSTRYYQLLFAERLGFQLVAFATRYPRLGPVAIVDDPLRGVGLPVPELIQNHQPAPLTLNWGRVDESFTVYDHPMPLVFRKTKQLPEDELRLLLQGEQQ